MAAVVLLVLVAAVAATPQLLGPKLTKALGEVGEADPVWLWSAGAAFVASLACTGLAWRAALVRLGAETGPVDSAARYGVGSLVNSFAPARLGDAVRIALFSQTLERGGRVWTTGGVFAAIGAARALALGAMVIAGAATTGASWWPLGVLVAAAGIAVVLSVLARKRRLGSRIAHLLDAFRLFGSQPRTALAVAGWIFAATAGRLAAAAAVTAAYGVPHPVLAALLIVAALDVAGLFPLTPGNWGVASGAIVVALQARGIALTDALTVGIGFHALETVISVCFGGLSAFLLAPVPGAVRRWALVGTAGACAVSAAAVMVPNLV
ncbi:MAG: lysylphosphatidylglycerol synthase domain-containing protein [Gaiellaceae bacterium]